MSIRMNMDVQYVVIETTYSTGIKMFYFLIYEKITRKMNELQFSTKKLI